jgi:hypothetical protein
LHGNLDALLPIRTDSNAYSRLVRDRGHGNMYRYYVIGKGNHVDSYYDDNKNKLRPMLPCHRDAFKALVAFVQRGVEPPRAVSFPNPGTWSTNAPSRQPLRDGSTVRVAAGRP